MVILQNLDKHDEEGIQYSLIGYDMLHRVYLPDRHDNPRMPAPSGRWLHTLDQTGPGGAQFGRPWPEDRQCARRGCAGAWETPGEPHEGDAMKVFATWTTAIGITVSALSAGCGGTYYRTRHLYNAPLDERYDVRLIQQSTNQVHAPLLEQRGEQIVVCVRPRPLKGATYTLERVDVNQWPSWSHFDYQDVEARVDADGRYIWFIDRTGGKVIGSVDRVTGQTTGPGDEPPEWATLDGGQRLDPGRDLAAAPDSALSP